MTRGADFDPQALDDFLTARFGKARLAIERISGGQSNPTYFIDFGPRRMVLRKKPNGEILRGAHAVEREYRVMSALDSAGFPVPHPILLQEDDDPLGTPFYLMDRVEGRVFHDCALPGLDPRERRGIYLGMAEAMARMHALRPDEIGLGDYGKPGNYFERQIRRWTRQLRDSPGKPIPALDRVADWLPQNMPPDDGLVSIAHGDFRLGNLMFHPERPEVVAVLDWELSTLGHPLADLGFCSMTWHSGPDEYGGILGHDLAVLGIPSQREFLDHYHAHARPTPPLLPFHLVFSLFRFAVIFVGIADRARVGNAASADADVQGPLAARFAERAVEVIRGERAW